MPRLSQTEIRNNAIAFVHEWKDETRERGEAQTFWNEFLEIFGIKRRRVAIFEKAVPKHNEQQGSIDLFWRGVLLVEHKSRGKSLDKALSQAFEYVENLEEGEEPELVLISDFENFRLYNLETGEEHAFKFAKLPELIHLFGAISGYQKREYREQDPVNIRVAMKLGELHDALKASGYMGHKLEAFLVRLVYCLFADDTGVFLPRSSFLFFLEEKSAEDGSNLGAMLAQLFQILDTPEAERQTTLDEDLRAFPHVNGELFRERFDFPSFDRKMRKLLIEACGFDWAKVSPAIFGSLFQSVMDPAKRRNLGAHYTSEKNILKVIHGLFLDELFEEFELIKNNLNKLRVFHDKLASLRFFDPACGSGNFLVITYREIRRLELEIIKQTHLLSGGQRAAFQFKTEELSRIDVNSFYGIEIEEFAAQIARVALWLTDHLANMELSAALGVPYTRLPLQHTPNIVHGNALRLDWGEFLTGTQASSPAMSAKREPAAAASDEADAGGTPALQSLYILGNPPFVGGKMMDEEQRKDMAAICKDVPNYGLLDYVCAWYIKAAEFLSFKASPFDVRKSYAFPSGVTKDTGGSAAEQGHSPESGGSETGEAELRRTSSGRALNTRIAFVSTNSITQGEQVGVLWSYLLSKGIKINFAHRTFKWSNEASGKAAVFCVIIGFGQTEIGRKRLFDYQTPVSEPHEIHALNINPYLVDAVDCVVSRRSQPYCAIPEMKFGNMPLDGGHLIIETPESRAQIIEASPELEKYIRPYVGAHEFLNGGLRWCFWFVGIQPNLIRSFSTKVKERIEAVRSFRESSVAPSTRKFSTIPYLFRDQIVPDKFLLFPRVSSERRIYVPIGFFDDGSIPADSCLIVSDATIFHFGVLTSTMHNAWMRQVCGRLESRYRYSKDIVYNNFPWPELSGGVSSPAVREGSSQPTGAHTDVRAAIAGDTRRLRVERTAQGILDARAEFPDATLADLYDPLTMPKDLLDAHRANDEAVDACYGKRKFANELERLEFLFELYRRYTEPLAVVEAKARRTRKKQ